MILLSFFLLLFPLLAECQYNDSFASAAAYSETPQVCASRALSDANVSRFVTAYCETYTCAGFTAISHSQEVIILSFRGPAEYMQLVEAGNTFWNADKVSHYFHMAFFTVWNGGLKDDFQRLAQIYPRYQVWVTGHSIGGAMASLATQYIGGAGLAEANQTLLVTFGQPRVGDQTYATYHDSYVRTSYRVIHNHDPVPHFPAAGTGYVHHKAEVWYANDMKAGSSSTLCSSVGEDPNCSNSVSEPYTSSEHSTYFGHDVGVWYKKKCK